MQNLDKKSYDSLNSIKIDHTKNAMQTATYVSSQLKISASDVKVQEQLFTRTGCDYAQRWPQDYNDATLQKMEPIQRPCS